MLRLAFGYPCVKTSRMLICFCFTVKQRDEPELERLFLLAWQRHAVKTIMKRAAGMKRATDSESISRKGKHKLPKQQL